MTVGNCSSAKDAWETLKNTYKAKTNARKLLLRRELTSLKMGAGEPLTKYAARAKDIQSKLQATGEEAKDQEVALQFLVGLPSTYDMISTVLTAGNSALTIDNVLPKLLSVEQMTTQSERPSEAALFAKPSGKPRSGSRQPQQPRKEERECFYCGKKGHLARHCMKKKPPMEEDITITFGNGGTGKATAIGKVLLHTPDAAITLHDVLFIPEAMENLVSVRHATKRGVEFKFCSNRCEIGRNGCTEAIAPCTEDAIYYLTGWCEHIDQRSNPVLVTRTKESPHLWHARFGHLGYDNLARVTNMVTGIHISAEEFKAAASEAYDFCEPCALGKQHRLPFRQSTSAATQPLALVHTDLCGPMPVTSLGGNKYFLTLLDDHSKLSVVRPLARKSEVAGAVKDTLTLLENQIGQRTKRLRCDNGSEYINNELTTFCALKGIKLETTVRYTPEQNGAAERLNRTLMDKVRPMLANDDLPKNLWAEAVTCPTCAPLERASLR
eukprot:scaffold14.g1341.t1